MDSNAGHDKDYAIGDEQELEVVEPQRGKITLASVHQSKGQEFRSVAVLGPLDGMPDARASTTDELEEETRIAYVAVTRACERPLFCASRQYADELGARVAGLPWSEYSLRSSSTR